jgi:hypothetical protein
MEDQHKLPRGIKVRYALSTLFGSEPLLYGFYLHIMTVHADDSPSIETPLNVIYKPSALVVELAATIFRSSGSGRTLSGSE